MFHGGTSLGLTPRNFLIPVPQVKNFAELNALILDRCRRHLGHTIRDREESVGELMRQEQRKLLPMPGLAFERWITF